MFHIQFVCQSLRFAKLPQVANRKGSESIVYIVWVINTDYPWHKANERTAYFEELAGYNVIIGLSEERVQSKKFQD